MEESKLLAHDTSNEKRATLLTRSWEIFGFGTQYAWILCLVHGSILFENADSMEWTHTVKALFLSGFALSYLVLYCVRKKEFFTLPNRAVTVSAGILGSLGTVLIVFPVEGLTGLAIIIVAALLVGMSSALLMTAGNKTWSQLRPERVMLHLAVSAFTASILYFVLLALPGFLSTSLACLLPGVGGFILSSTKKNKPRARSYRHIDSSADKSVTTRVLVYVAAFAAPMGFVVGAACGGDSESFVSLSIAIVAGIFLSSAFAFVCAIRLSPFIMLKRLSQAGVPIMVIGCILVIALPGYISWLGYTFIACGFALSDLFMWFINAELVSRSGRSSFEVLCRSCFIEWGFLAVGFMLASFFASQEIEGIGMPGMVLVLAMCGIVLTIINGFVFTPVNSMRIIEAREGDAGEERLESFCAVIAEQHNLSGRESEIMLYLASGRSVPYIQEKLTLSQSTVKTHVRNIYRKLSIDNKQALLDMIEEISIR